ncbi:MAG: MFS transporter, partial [Rectinemataceae bacterium]|nr:MFS transporter [Rectinemataceae bacterium]
MNTTFKPSTYRWAVLSAYVLLSIVIQIQWVAFAPVARAAERFYGAQIAPGSLFGVDFLAMLYLIVFLAVCVPASYVIDTYGIRVGIGIGAILAGTAGLAKGFFAGNFAIVLCAQLVLSIAQPFILNAATALAAQWFPLRQRGLAVGLGTLAQYIGIVIAMVAGPILVNGNPASPLYGSGVGKLLIIYGIVTAVAAAISLVTIREPPPGASGESSAGGKSGTSGDAVVRQG